MKPAISYALAVSLMLLSASTKSGGIPVGAELVAPGTPYSPGILAGNTLYVAALQGTDPKTQALPADFGQETKNCIENLGRVLYDARMDYSDVVSVQIYLGDMSQFKQVNTIIWSTSSTHCPLEQLCRPLNYPREPTSRSPRSRGNDVGSTANWKRRLPAASSLVSTAAPTLPLPLPAHESPSRARSCRLTRILATGRFLEHPCSRKRNSLTQGTYSGSSTIEFTTSVTPGTLAAADWASSLPKPSARPFKYTT
jgi:enamine deaminase RidA (YjgF/YER057c/UK114 family)